MNELDKDVKITNIVAAASLGYNVDIEKYHLDNGKKIDDFIKNKTTLNNKVMIDGVNILIFANGKVVLYGKSIDELNKRWNLIKEFASKYKV